MGTVLLVGGGALLLGGLILEELNQPRIHRQKATEIEFQGAFRPHSVQRYTFQFDSQPPFRLLLARYEDAEGRSRSAIFPPTQGDGQSILPGRETARLRSIWQEAAQVIDEHTSQQALFLSWWDTGQRIHFLSGREAWIHTPSKHAFPSPIWEALQAELSAPSASQDARQGRLARWLTMDADKAIAAIREQFGGERSLYLAVTSDLLLRQSELVNQGGQPLPLAFKRFPATGDLHGTIGRVKSWAQGVGQGNYLVRRQGDYYQAWAPQSKAGQQTLLVRLLPFVDSLKKPLPGGLSLVYQSKQGMYLSIYRIPTQSSHPG